MESFTQIFVIYGLKVRRVVNLFHLFLDISQLTFKLLPEISMKFIVIDKRSSNVVEKNRRFQPEKKKVQFIETMKISVTFIDHRKTSI